MVRELLHSYPCLMTTTLQSDTDCCEQCYYFTSTTPSGQEGSRHTSSVHSILQLVKKLMERANQPRTALMLPAIVYAHLVLLDMANVRGSAT